MSDLEVHVVKQVNAPIEKVFDAWLDVSLLSKFMTPMLGMPEPRVEVEAKQGGSFAIYMQVGEQVIPHKGEYLEVNRPNKLVFSWDSPFSTAGSTVTILFKKINANTTELELRHMKFKDEEARSDHEGGWNNILVKLGEVINIVAQQQAIA